MAETPMEIEKTQKMYLTTALTYLVYLKDKSYADKAQDDYEEQMRKIRK